MLRAILMVRASICGPEGFVVLTQDVPCLREASTTASCVDAVYLLVCNFGRPQAESGRKRLGDAGKKAVDAFIEITTSEHGHGGEGWVMVYA